MVVMPLVDFSVRQRKAVCDARDEVGRPVGWVELVLSFKDAFLLPTHPEASLLYSSAFLSSTGHSLRAASFHQRRPRQLS